MGCIDEAIIQSNAKQRTSKPHYWQRLEKTVLAILRLASQTKRKLESFRKV